MWFGILCVNNYYNYYLYILVTTVLCVLCSHRLFYRRCTV